MTTLEIELCKRLRSIQDQINEMYTLMGVYCSGAATPPSPPPPPPPPVAMESLVDEPVASNEINIADVDKVVQPDTGDTTSSLDLFSATTSAVSHRTYGVRRNRNALVVLPVPVNDDIDGGSASSDETEQQSSLPPPAPLPLQEVTVKRELVARDAKRATVKRKRVRGKALRRRVMKKNASDSFVEPDDVEQVWSVEDYNVDSCADSGTESRELSEALDEVSNQQNVPDKLDESDESVIRANSVVTPVKRNAKVVRGVYDIIHDYIVNGDAARFRSLTKDRVSSRIGYIRGDVKITTKFIRMLRSPVNRDLRMVGIRRRSKEAPCAMCNRQRVTTGSALMRGNRMAYWVGPFCSERLDLLMKEVSLVGAVDRAAQEYTEKSDRATFATESAISFLREFDSLRCEIHKFMLRHENKHK